MRPFFPGLVKNPDIRNEAYLVNNHAHILGIAGSTMTTMPFVPKKRHWRKGWADNDQGQTPRCTAFGPLTAVSCTRLAHPDAVIDPQKMYEENQAYDRAHGNNYSEGATTIAAMETLKTHGFIRGYYWLYDMDTLLRALAKGVVVVGTDWLSTWFDKDVHDIIRTTPTSTSAGGHCYTISGYDPKTDLLTIPQTWGDGEYLISADDFYKVFRNGGEGTVMDEVRRPIL